MSETTYCIIIGILISIISLCIGYWILACFCPSIRCCLERKRFPDISPNEDYKI